MAKLLTMKDAELARDAITKEQTQHISQLYKEWAKEIGEQAKYYSQKTTASSSFSERYMIELRKQMNQNSKLVANEIYSSTKGSLLQVSDAVVRSNVDWMKSIGFGGGSAALSYIPNDTVTRLVTGQIYDSGWSLSKAIWSDNQKTLQDIYTIMAKGTAEQLSVYEIAKQLESYVDPSKALAWNYARGDGVHIYKKQVDYNAQRLVRTLAQHAYQQSMVSAAANNPFMQAFVWHSNGPAVCPLCADMNGQVFKKNDVPFDHPNGMCTLEPVIDPDMESKLAAWVKDEGDFPEIDKFAELVGGTNSGIMRAEFLAKYGALTGKGSEYSTWWTWLDKLPQQAQVEAKLIKESSGKGWGPWYKENIYKGTSHVAGTKKEASAISNVAKTQTAKKATTTKVAKQTATKEVVKPKAYAKKNFLSTLTEGSSYGMSATYSEIETLYGKQFLDDFKAALHALKNEGAFTSHLEAFKGFKGGETNKLFSDLLTKHESTIKAQAAKVKAEKVAAEKAAKKAAKEAEKAKAAKLAEAKKKAAKVLGGAKQEDDYLKWWKYVKSMDDDTLKAVAKTSDFSVLTQAEKDAIVSYTGSFYERANELMREMAEKGWSLEELYKAHILDDRLKDLISAFEKLTIDEAMYVRRGSSFGDIANFTIKMDEGKQTSIFGQAGLDRRDMKTLLKEMSVEDLNAKLAGEVVQYDNFISTSVASNKGFTGGLETVFYLPKGTNASIVMDISRYGISEGELIIGNGHRAVIRGFEYLERAHKHANVRMYVEIIPKN